MTEIDYGRLDALEFALGGRAAIEAAYVARVPLLTGGGGGGGGGAGVTLQTSFVALTFAGGAITSDFEGVDQIGLSYDPDAHTFALPHAGIYFVDARFADTIAPIRTRMADDGPDALTKDCLVIWSLDVLATATQGGNVVANPIAHGEHVAGVWGVGSDPAAFGMHTGGLRAKLTICAQDAPLGGDGSFGSFRLSPTLTFLPLDGITDPYSPELDGQAVFLVGCVPL